MANLVAPRGFTPKRHMDGSPFNGQTQLMVVPSSDASAAIFVGDVVILQGAAAAAGTVINGVNCEGLQQVIKASTGVTGQNIAGVVTGFLPDPTNLALRYRPVSTARLALVSTDLTVIYQVQEDAVGGVIAPADIGLNFTFNIGTGNIGSGQSTATLVSNVKTNLVTAPWKLLGLAKFTGNAFNVAGAGSDPGTFEVMLNTSVYANNVVGV